MFSATLCLFLLSFERRLRSMLTKRMICLCFLQLFVCVFLVLSDDAGQCWQREWLPTLAALQLPFVCSSLDQTLHPSSKPSVYLCIFVWLPLFVYLFVFNIVCLFICCLFPRPDQWLLFICLCHCVFAFNIVCLFFVRQDPSSLQTIRFSWYLCLFFFASETRPMVVINLPL